MMLNHSVEELNQKQAKHTTLEIKQQPDLWKETFSVFEKKQSEIEEFLTSFSDTSSPVDIIFTGAGTSAYVGETIASYLNQKNKNKHWQFKSIPTTSIVSNPYECLEAGKKTLLVSFARSGNSPESVGAVQTANQVVEDLYQLTITCAADGQLARKAQGDDKNLVLLMPEKSNDKSFAMTGAFTCMTLAALLVFDTENESWKKQAVNSLADMGNSLLERESIVEEIVEADFDRVVYLGAGSLEGLSREAQLKMLELTAGDIVTAFDSPLGFRHGPKSIVNESTLLFVFCSGHKYTRLYDIDLLKEVKEDGIAADIWAIDVESDESRQQDWAVYDGNRFVLQTDQTLPDAYVALAYILFAQLVGLFTSVKIGNTPDNPSPSGTVNRVVKGVHIHEYEAD